MAGPGFGSQHAPGLEFTGAWACARPWLGGEIAPRASQGSWSVQVGVFGWSQVRGLEHTSAWDCSRPLGLVWFFLLGCRLSLFVFSLRPSLGSGLTCVGVWSLLGCWVQGVALQQRRVCVS